MKKKKSNLFYFFSFVFSMYALYTMNSNVQFFSIFALH